MGTLIILKINMFAYIEAWFDIAKPQRITEVPCSGTLTELEIQSNSIDFHQILGNNTDLLQTFTLLTLGNTIIA